MNAAEYDKLPSQAINTPLSQHCKSGETESVQCKGCLLWIDFDGSPQRPLAYLCFALELLLALFFLPPRAFLVVLVKAIRRLPLRGGIEMVVEPHARASLCERVRETKCHLLPKVAFIYQTRGAVEPTQVLRVVGLKRVKASIF